MSEEQEQEREEEEGRTLESVVRAQYDQNQNVTRDSNTLELTDPRPEKVGMLTDLDDMDIDVGQYGEGYFGYLGMALLYPGAEFFFTHLKPAIERLKVNKKGWRANQFTDIQKGEGGRQDIEQWIRGTMEERGKKE